MTIAMMDLPEEEIALEGGRGSPGFRTLRRILKRPLAVVCLIIIIALYLVGIFAPWIAPYGYAEQNLDISFEGPSWDHPFGTDRNGRDLLSRTIWAMRTTVIVTMATIMTGGILLPLTLGMLAGYRRGMTDSVIMRTGEILASLPGLPMLILINATLRPRFVEWAENLGEKLGTTWFTDSGFADYFLIFFVLSLFGWVGGARLIRTQTLTLRGAEYVRAAESFGASTPRILFRHLLPGVMPLIILGLSAGLGTIALAEIGLTFIGVGIQPPQASFGALIQDGAPRTVFENHPELLLVPGTVVVLLLLSFNLLGDAMNDVVTSRHR
jgi:ABC-type dipeptide/oligopeptide/nickel transport system permease subunit